MGQTRKIVVERFPVDRLPEELRRGLESGCVVQITLEEEVEPADLAPSDKPRSLSSYLGAGQGVYSADEAVSYIRKLRDE